MKLTDKLNGWLHPLMIKYVIRQYFVKSRKVEVQHPELFKPAAPEL